MKSNSVNSVSFTKIFAFAMMAAPIVQLVADILWFGNGVLLTGTVFRQISYVLFIPAVFGMLYLAPSKIGVVALWLCLLGIGGGIAIVALYRVGSGAEVGQSGLPLFVEQAFSASPGLGISIFIPGILFPLGQLALALAFWRECSQQRLLSFLLVSIGILFFMGNALEIKIALFTSDVLMIIVYCWMARRNVSSLKSDTDRNLSDLMTSGSSPRRA
jgi:hypothetical protein